MNILQITRSEKEFLGTIRYFKEIESTKLHDSLKLYYKSTSTFSKIINSLLKKAMIKVRNHSNDNRKRLYSLTSHGEKQFELDEYERINIHVRPFLLFCVQKLFQDDANLESDAYFINQFMENFPQEKLTEWMTYSINLARASYEQIKKEKRN